MAITSFHQCGHNSVWNRDSLENDACGDGLILSPLHWDREKIESLSGAIKQKSLFDPQYYLPNSQKAKLNTYDFFPEAISNGYVSTDFHLLALESARKCVEFQVEQGFRRIVIPARHFVDMITDYTDRQDAYTVHPFLQAIDEFGYKGDVFLTLPITRAMLMHEGYRVDLLNWITSYPRIEGVYLLVDDDRNSKQIQDGAFLKEYLTAVKELSDADLVVTIGHSNTEGLLFSLIDQCELTFGAYENTRIFSIDKFVISDEERRGPKSRLYLSGLLNWVQFSHAKEISASEPDIWRAVYDETPYGESALNAVKEPHFTSPNLYKHFFISYTNQINELSACDPLGRYKLLRRWLLEARDLYEAIEEIPIDFDRHGRGDHIQVWLDTINSYRKEFMV